jgi:hypothetical protein
MPTANAQLAALLETPELAALGPGPCADRQSIPALDSVLDGIFRGEKFAPQQQSLIRALIFLWHDHLDESHSLAQEIPTVDGSFIHGIMHRREPDYGNAKYWFHRVGSHETFKSIAQKAAAIPASEAERSMLARFSRNESWDPFAFVDCCHEDAQSASGHELFLRRIQQAEFVSLLEHLAAWA